MSQVPALGPRGEGWVALQVAALGLVVIGSRVGTRFEIGDVGLQSILAVIGNVVVAVGVVVLVLAVFLLRGGGAFTVFPRPIPTGRLVESGPYRFIRHPVYSGLILASFGAALVRPSLVSLLAAILLLVILDLKRRREEAWLAARYPGYSAYRSRTKALIPGLY